MLPIILCDDNTELLQQFQTTVSNTILIEDLDAHIYHAYTSSNALARALPSLPFPALYLLDAEFPGEMDGFTLAKLIREHDPNGFIVFITTHENWTPLTFKYRLEAMDYIWKDSAEDIHIQIRECILEAYKRYCSKHNVSISTVSIKTSLGERVIPTHMIYAVATCEKAHTLRIYTDNTILETRDTLTRIGSGLGTDFWQSHKSCIVALKRISFIDPKSSQVFLDNGASFPLSKKNLKNLHPKETL